MTEAQRSSSSKPHRLVLALRTMWALYFFAAMYAVMLITRLLVSGEATVGMLLPVGVSYFLVLLGIALLIHLVGRGKNWARIAYVVGACLVLVALAAALLGNLRAPTIAWLPLVLVSVLIFAYGYIVHQLLHSSSREWFHAERGREPS